jgi:hypothetical protein
MGATEDAASRRPARPGDTRLQCETSSKVRQAREYRERVERRRDIGAELLLGSAGPRRLAAGMWMRLEEDLAPPPVRDVRVALGRPEVGVPEHLLHGAKIGASFEEMRREGVAEQVGVDTLRLEPGLARETAQDEEGAGAGEGAAARVQEELWSIAAVEMRPAEREVATRSLCGGAAEGHQALLASLANDADDPVVEVDGALLEADCLGDAQPRSVQELD